LHHAREIRQHRGRDRVVARRVDKADRLAARVRVDRLDAAVQDGGVAGLPDRVGAKIHRYRTAARAREVQRVAAGAAGNAAVHEEAGIGVVARHVEGINAVQPDQVEIGDTRRGNRLGPGQRVVGKHHLHTARPRSGDVEAVGQGRPANLQSVRTAAADIREGHRPAGPQAQVGQGQQGSAPLFRLDGGRIRRRSRSEQDQRLAGRRGVRQVVRAAQTLNGQVFGRVDRDRNGLSARDPRPVVGQLVHGDVVVAGRAVDNHRVAARRIAAVDGDGRQIGGRGRRVVQVDHIAPADAVDRQSPLAGKLDRLEGVDLDQPGGQAVEQRSRVATVRSLDVVDGVVRTGAVDREDRRRDVVLHGLQVDEVDLHQRRIVDVLVQQPAFGHRRARRVDHFVERVRVWSIADLQRVGTGAAVEHQGRGDRTGARIDLQRVVAIQAVDLQTAQLRVVNRLAQRDGQVRDDHRIVRRIVPVALAGTQNHQRIHEPGVGHVRVHTDDLVVDTAGQPLGRNLEAIHAGVVGELDPREILEIDRRPAVNRRARGRQHNRRPGRDLPGVVAQIVVQFQRVAEAVAQQLQVLDAEEVQEGVAALRHGPRVVRHAGPVTDAVVPGRQPDVAVVHQHHVAVARSAAFDRQPHHGGQLGRRRIRVRHRRQPHVGHHADVVVAFQSGDGQFAHAAELNRQMHDAVFGQPHLVDVVDRIHLFGLEPVIAARAFDNQHVVLCAEDRAGTLGHDRPGRAQVLVADRQPRIDGHAAAVRGAARRVRKHVADARGADDRERVVATLTVQLQVLDLVDRDRDRPGVDDRPGIAARRRVLDQVLGRRAVDNQRIAARRIAAVDGDLGQPVRRRRVVQVDLVAAGAGVDRQRRLVGELEAENLEFVDGHYAGRIAIVRGSRIAAVRAFHIVDCVGRRRRNDRQWGRNVREHRLQVDVGDPLVGDPVHRVERIDQSGFGDASLALARPGQDLFRPGRAVDHLDAVEALAGQCADERVRIAEVVRVSVAVHVKAVHNAVVIDIQAHRALEDDRAVAVAVEGDKRLGHARRGDRAVAVVDDQHVVAAQAEDVQRFQTGQADLPEVPFAQRRVERGVVDEHVDDRRIAVVAADLDDVVLARLVLVAKHDRRGVDLQVQIVVVVRQLAELAAVAAEHAQQIQLVRAPRVQGRERGHHLELAVRVRYRVVRDIDRRDEVEIALVHAVVVVVQLDHQHFVRIQHAVEIPVRQVQRDMDHAVAVLAGDELEPVLVVLGNRQFVEHRRRRTDQSEVGGRMDRVEEHIHVGPGGRHAVGPGEEGRTAVAGHAGVAAAGRQRKRVAPRRAAVPAARRHRPSHHVHVAVDLIHIQRRQVADTCGNRRGPRRPQRVVGVVAERHAVPRGDVNPTVVRAAAAVHIDTRIGARAGNRRVGKERRRIGHPVGIDVEHRRSGVVVHPRNVDFARRADGGR